MWYQVLSFYNTNEPETACFYFKSTMKLDDIIKNEKLISTIMEKVENVIPETFHITITEFIDLNQFESFSSDLLIAPNGKILVDFVGEDEIPVTSLIIH